MCKGFKTLSKFTWLCHQIFVSTPHSKWTSPNYLGPQTHHSTAVAYICIMHKIHQMGYTTFNVLHFSYMYTKVTCSSMCCRNTFSTVCQGIICSKRLMVACCTTNLTPSKEVGERTLGTPVVYFNAYITLLSNHPIVLRWLTHSWWHKSAN